MDRHGYFLQCWYVHIFSYMFFHKNVNGCIDPVLTGCLLYLKFTYYNVLQCTTYLSPKKIEKYNPTQEWMVFWLVYLFGWLIHGYPLISANFSHVFSGWSQALQPSSAKWRAGSGRPVPWAWSGHLRAPERGRRRHGNRVASGGTLMEYIGYIYKQI